MAPYVPVCDKWAVIMYKHAGESATVPQSTGVAGNGKRGGGPGLLNNRVLSCHE
jgi:hypothetical protein